jgi:3-oxoacyl-[acyl-carrier protein] reductase
VVLAARSADELEATRAAICADGGDADCRVTDLARETDIVGLFAGVQEQYGRLDILVNNAGTGVYGSTETIRAEDVDAMLAVNVRGTLLCCREAIGLMRPQRSGYVINISSVLGFKGYPEQAAYTATKHGVVGLTKVLAAEHHGDGIRFSLVSPGGTDTEMVRQSRPDLSPDVLLQPDDIADAVEYLLSLSEHAAVDEIYVRRRGSKPF